MHSFSLGGKAGWFGHRDNASAARGQQTGQYIDGKHVLVAIPPEMIRRLSVLLLFWDHIYSDDIAIVNHNNGCTDIAI